MFLLFRLLPHPNVSLQFLSPNYLSSNFIFNLLIDPSHFNRVLTHHWHMLLPKLFNDTVGRAPDITLAGVPNAVGPARL
jgi:hypothetical protein